MSARQTARARIRDVGMCAALLITVLALSAIPLIRDSETRLSDTFFRVASGSKQPSQVVVVLIDDDALRAYGRWPWARILLAQLTSKLSRAGASVIGLDVLVSEPQSADNDRALQLALQQSGRIVLAGKIGSFPDGPRWVEPMPEFALSAAAVGHAQAVLDSDSVCRRFPPKELTVDGPRWAFAIEVARQFNPEVTKKFLASYGMYLDEDTSQISIAKPVLLPIAYVRNRFTTISAAAVLQGADLSILKGHAVLVGFGPTEIGDRLTTPLSGEYPTPGIEVHAQIVDSILSGRTLNSAPLWFFALVLCLTCGFVVLTCRRWRGWRAAGILGVLAGLLYGFGVAAFVLANRMIALGPMMLAVVAGPLLVYTADFVDVERSVNRQLRGLRSWLASHSRAIQTQDAGDLSWKLELLQKLQTELGAWYELHEALLESSHDLVAIFDHHGRHLLSNRRFVEACPDTENEWDLDQFLTLLAPNIDDDLLSAGKSQQKEVRLQNELFALNMTPLPPTFLSPEGGTIVTLSSLRTREERDRARAEALSFITHELRTPLTSIQGFAEMMMRYPGISSAASAPETIFRESRRLLALINSYLDVMRLDAGAKDLCLQDVEVEQVIRNALEILAPIARASGMTMSVETAEGSLTATADAPLISGAVLNLVSNAIKYGKPNTPILVKCSPDGREVVIAVSNEVEPLGQPDIARLFEPYYRGEHVQGASNGWGLGLAFVRRIAEKHSGSIKAVIDGQRITFELRIPAKRAAAAAVAERKS
ncbi:MAG TPA: CHASE2 domain-containing protein [Terriglobales bacterium]|nr:CHASE2 domain-containing protein [Terriglobales bacterium]